MVPVSEQLWHCLCPQIKVKQNPSPSFYENDFLLTTPSPSTLPRNEDSRFWIHMPDRVNLFCNSDILWPMEMKKGASFLATVYGAEVFIRVWVWVCLSLLVLEFPETQRELLLGISRFYGIPYIQTVFPIQAITKNLSIVSFESVTNYFASVWRLSGGIACLINTLSL